MDNAIYFLIGFLFTGLAYWWGHRRGRAIGSKFVTITMNPDEATFETSSQLDGSSLAILTLTKKMPPMIGGLDFISCDLPVSRIP